MSSRSLTRGGHVPHFTVPGLGGRRVAYSDIWQRRNLLLVSLPDDVASESEPYVAQLERTLAELSAQDTACVITRAEIPGVPRPSVIVADRWGEVHFVAAPGTAAELPAVAELVEWLRHVQMQCPECEGEAK